MVVRRYDRNSFSKSAALLTRCHGVIPAGAHTYSKGDDCFPEYGPHYLVRGQGCRVWDVDGNELIDMGMGLTAVGLGHAYEPVLERVRGALTWGVNYSLPHVSELELAERLCDLIPGAEMVKLSKHGSDATTGAVKLARAYTGREMIALCGDQPFFSTNDWFIGTTPCDAGIPEKDKTLSVKFKYNDLEDLSRRFEEHPGKIACVMLQPMEFDEPNPGYLQGVLELCRKHGALLIFDEVISGFRWHLRGAQHVFGVTPDLTSLGKCLANGFSVSALVGRRDVMELGGTQQKARPRVFLLSTTHGGEIHGIAAALATLEIMEREHVADHMMRIGRYFIEGFNARARKRGVQEFLYARGWGCRPLVVTKNAQGMADMSYRTLFMQEMTFRGILIPQVAPAFTMTERDMDEVLEAADETMAVYAQGLEQGLDGLLLGRSIKAVFRRMNA